MKEKVFCDFQQAMDKCTPKKCTNDNFKTNSYAGFFTKTTKPQKGTD